MKQVTTVIVLALAVGAAFQAVAAQPLRCVIEPDKVAEIGTPVIGVVESVLVDRGDVVRQGQLLAQLRANVERASVNAAEVRAQADADVQAAIANYDFQKQKLARTEELMLKKFVSAQALDQVRAETSVAEQRLAQAREQKRVAHQELQTANAQLSLRQIRAPFSGIIADRYVNAGERVEVKPMFRIARIDPLRVEIIAPAALYGSIKKGMPAQIIPELPNAGRLDTKVVLVDRIIDAASNTFRVRAELPNSNGAVPSGLRCRAELQGVEAAAPQPPAAPRADTAAPRKQAALRLETRMASKN
jgi:cobalt-zinc-cadmium efflux system membrane fusion protein